MLVIELRMLPPFAVTLAVKPSGTLFPLIRKTCCDGDGVTVVEKLGANDRVAAAGFVGI
jgi:hypothetical protein